MPTRPPRPSAVGAVRELAPARLARTGEVLDLVRRREATTTSQLAERMGLSRSTVTERVDLLVEHGLLRTTMRAVATGRGRPPAVLSFAPDAGVVLSAQIGLSGARVAVTDLDGTVRRNRLVDLDLSWGPAKVSAVLARAFDRALRALGEDPSRVLGVGVGIPGAAELRGVEGGPGTDAWDGPAVSDRLADRYGVPAYVDRDVNLLALAEQRISWPDARVLLCLKAGTGLGCGLVVDGRVVRGAGGLAGELGHVRVPGYDDPCACGNRGCLAVVAGGGAVVRRLRAEGIDVGSTRDLTRLGNRDDIAVVQAVRDAGRHIGEAVATLVTLLNPDVVTVWGYLADVGDVLLSGMRESIARTAEPGAAAAVAVHRARLGDDAGIRGAAHTVLEHRLSPEAVDRFLADAHAPS